MEAFKTKQENTFKNKVIYFLLLIVLGQGFYFVYKTNDLIDKYTELTYFISPDMTFLGKVDRSYKRTSAIEIKAHARLFYATMFSFSADNYKENTDFAKQNLVDHQTGVYIESRFTEADMYNKLLRSNGQILTLLDSISTPDLRKEPILITAYCRQALVVGEEKSEQPFINTYELYYADIPRTDENPMGLQIRNWKNVRLEENK